MLQYFPDDQRVFNDGYDPDLAAAVFTELDTDLEHPLRRCAQLMEMWRSAGGVSG